MARRRISGVKLAEGIGRAQQYVSRRLNGDVAFDLDDLEKIAVVLDVTLPDLLPPAALQRRAQATGEQAMKPSFALAERRRPASARRRRVAVRRRGAPDRTDDTGPSSHARGVATTPMTRRAALIPRTSNR